VTPLSELVTIARAAHEMLCIDTCVVTRVTPGPLNTTTGLYPSSTATLYTGACRVEVVTPVDVPTEPLERERARPRMTLPWSAAASLVLSMGDLVAVTSTDPRLNAQAYSVVSEIVGSTASARRYILEEVE